MDDLLDGLRNAVHGRYEISRELGRGGMGAVFLARDVALDREVAIKVMPPELALQPVLRERFVREARLVGSLSHPNIIHVHAIEEHADLIAFVMEFVDGETLAERVARAGPLDPEALARMLQDAAWALGYAHGRGVVHRDVKPDNLMLERGTGRVRIMDFGIARKEQASSLTEVGQSIGTPHYMSPEQIAAESVDGRSDLYSLGCVGFFAGTGRPPFDASSAHKLLMKPMTEMPPAAASVRPGFPDGLDRVLQRCLRKDAAERYETGEAMAEAIGALQMRSREIAPLLRLFHQQTAQSFQMFAMLVVLFGVFLAYGPRNDEALRLMTGLLFGTIAFTIFVQSLDRVRFAVRQGFTIADVEAAFDAIGDETARARAQLIGDPVEYRRIQRRKRIAMAGGFLGGLSIPLAVKMFVQGADGSARATPAAALLLTIGTVVFGISIAFWAMRPVRVTLPQKSAARFWSSRLGRAIFARAERRQARERERLATVA